MNIYCVKEKKKTGTTGITAHIASNNRKYIKGKCTSCGINKTSFVSDSEIEAAGIKDIFKKIKPVIKNFGKKILNNPQRALELSIQLGQAGATKNPVAMAALAPQLATFAKTGKGVKGKGLYLKR